MASTDSDSDSSSSSSESSSESSWSSAAPQSTDSSSESSDSEPQDSCATQVQKQVARWIKESKGGKIVPQYDCDGDDAWHRLMFQPYKRFIRNLVMSMKNDDGSLSGRLLQAVTYTRCLSYLYKSYANILWTCSTKLHAPASWLVLHIA